MAGVDGGEMRIGIDLGGTKIEVIALGSDGTSLLRHRVPTPANDYPKILQAIADVVCFVESELGQKGTVGIGTPGAISPTTGYIKNSNSIVLNGMPLDRDISKKLERPIRIENDANCFALSEAVDGAAAQARVVFGVILGTGVGGGIVVDKQVITGRNKIAGEWGHSELPWMADRERPKAACYCGKVGCIETFLSGAGLSREYGLRTGIDSTPPEIVLASTAGDNKAAECLDLYQDRLARGLAGVINLLTQMSLSLVAVFPILRSYMRSCLALSANTYSLIPSTRPLCALCTEMLAGCVVQPGYGLLRRLARPLR
jgi:fructokinase